MNYIYQNKAKKYLSLEAFISELDVQFLIDFQISLIKIYARSEIKTNLNYSVPVMPNDSGVYPFKNSKGKIPIPTRLLLWILS